MKKLKKKIKKIKKIKSGARGLGLCRKEILTKHLQILDFFVIFINFFRFWRRLVRISFRQRPKPRTPDLFFFMFFFFYFFGGPRNFWGPCPVWSGLVSCRPVAPQKFLGPSKKEKKRKIKNKKNKK